jgi:hypothetical protein
MTATNPQNGPETMTTAANVNAANQPTPYEALWAAYWDLRRADAARGHLNYPTATRFFNANRVAMETAPRS